MDASRRLPGSGRLTVALLGLTMSIGLAGCVTESPEAEVKLSDFKASVARGEMKSPRPAAIALASIEGAPEAVIAHLRQAVTTQAADREVAFADPALARYFVRGYLDAYTTDDGTSIRYVWDVFDSTKRRTRRLDDGIDIPGSVADPWSVLDDKVLDAIASRSADSIAAYLATTPEAEGAPLAGAPDPVPAPPK